MDDARALGFCVRGVREFCAQTGLDFRKVVSDGIPMEQARAMQDGRMDMLIRHVEGRRG